MANKKEVKKEAPKAAGKPEVKAVEPVKPVISPVSGPKRIKVDAEQLAKLQAEGKLIGYDPATNEALIK